MCVCVCVCERRSGASTLALTTSLVASERPVRVLALVDLQMCEVIEVTCIQGIIMPYLYRNTHITPLYTHNAIIHT